MTKEEKIKYALKEIIRLSRYYDNFFWVISSFWMGGTGFAISKALELEDCPYYNLYMRELSSITILVWILYLLYMRYMYKLGKKYMEKANKYEEILDIDILPKKPIKGFRFMWLMIFVAVLSIIVMIVFFINTY